MSVSLKKPDKVDLSKPDLPRKLPEYTPVHLIDEEETIESLRDHLKTIDLDFDDLEDFIEKSELEKRRFDIKLGNIISFVIALAIFISFVALMINCFKSIEIDTEPEISTVSSLFDFLGNILSSVLNWFLTSPGGLLILGFSLLGLVIHMVSSITKFR